MRNDQSVYVRDTCRGIDTEPFRLWSHSLGNSIADHLADSLYEYRVTDSHHNSLYEYCATDPHHNCHYEYRAADYHYHYCDADHFTSKASQPGTRLGKI